jgi:hypothetical protein
LVKIILFDDFVVVVLVVDLFTGTAVVVFAFTNDCCVFFVIALTAELTPTVLGIPTFTELVLLFARLDLYDVLEGP